MGLMNSAWDLGLDANARRVCYPNAHLINEYLLIKKKLQREALEPIWFRAVLDHITKNS